MSQKDIDLESYWRRVRQPRQSVLAPSWTASKAIENAVIKTNLALPLQLKEFEIDPKIASKIATHVVQTFLEHWYEETRRGEASNLIAVVLEAQDLPLLELRSFVRALPQTLLDRVTQAPGPRASGLQALLAIEDRRRRGGYDYDISRDLDGVLTVTFSTPDPRADGQPIVFRLDENFEIR